MDESAKATAIETASAISSARACVPGMGSEVMAAAYGSGLNGAADSCWLARLQPK
jgi:hypothetical protein